MTRTWVNEQHVTARASLVKSRASVRIVAHGHHLDSAQGDTAQSLRRCETAQVLDQAIDRVAIELIEAAEVAELALLDPLAEAVLSTIPTPGTTGIGLRCGSPALRHAAQRYQQPARVACHHFLLDGKGVT